MTRDGVGDNVWGVVGVPVGKRTLVGESVAGERVGVIVLSAAVGSLLMVGAHVGLLVLSAQLGLLLIVGAHVGLAVLWEVVGFGETVGEAVAIGDAVGEEEGFALGDDVGWEETVGDALGKYAGVGLDELVGIEEGDSLGEDEGMVLGPLLGWKDGWKDGSKEGWKEGLLDGYDVGSDEGIDDGWVDGTSEGIVVGANVGSSPGLEVGDCDDSVGSFAISDVGFEVPGTDVVGLEVVGRCPAAFCPAAFHGVGCDDVGCWGGDHQWDRWDQLFDDHPEVEWSFLPLLLFSWLGGGAFQFDGPLSDLELTAVSGKSSSFQFQAPDRFLFLLFLLTLINFLLPKLFWLIMSWADTAAAEQHIMHAVDITAPTNEDRLTVALPRFRVLVLMWGRLSSTIICCSFCNGVISLRCNSFFFILS